MHFLSGHYIEVQIKCYIDHCLVQSGILLKFQLHLLCSLHDVYNYQ